MNNPNEFNLFDDLVDSFDVDRELTLKFFLVFAWMENHFKIWSDFWKEGRHQIIVIDWRSFGDSLDESFDPNRTPELQEAIEFLRESRPRAQRVRNGAIEWVDPDPYGDTELAQILALVTRVRNNFFHGGKFPRFRERDADLFRACLIVLRECVKLHPELSEYYRWQLEGVQG